MIGQAARDEADDGALGRVDARGELLVIVQLGSGSVQGG